MKAQTSKTRTLLAGAVFVALVVSPLARADYQSTVLSQSPVGYWRLNETLQPQNIAGAANSGTLGASVLGTYNSFPTRGLTGPFAGSTAVGLDGSAQTITTPWQAGINPSPFSVELWINPAQASFFGYVGSSVHIASPRSGWYLAQDNGATFGHGDSFVIRLFNQNGATPTITLWAPVLGGGIWHHLVLTYDGANAALYENGALASGSGPAAFVANVDSQFSLGSRSDNAFFWPGQVAEVAIYGVGLTAAKVASHYTVATNTPASYAATITADSPALYYRFQEAIDPPAANSGSLGSSVNGLYIYDTKAGVTGPTTPTFPGFDAANKAAAFDAGGGVVRIPPLNLNTNTVTFSCWISATNAQPIGAGLVLHGSGANACGLTIDQVNGGLGLGYIWNGQTYGISPSADFGLPPLPDSQWAYAALVIQPSEAELYICDANNFANWASITNTYTVNHLAQQFASATLAGAAGGYANRNFNGALDEVAIWNRALAAGELYSQYAAAVGGVPPRIFTDLQGPAIPPYEGDSLVLTVDAGGTPPLTYVWRTNGVFRSTTTTGTLTIADATTLDSGSYDVTITNLSGNATGTAVVVTVNPGAAPIITKLAGFQSRTLYPTGTLNMAVIGTGGGLKYQWYKDSAAIGPATNSSLRIPNLTTANAGGYSVSVTNTHGSASNGPVAITIPATVAGTYEAAVIAAAPESWWRLDEASGSTNMFDGMGRHDGIYTNATGSATLPALGVTGALLAGGNTAASFSSTDHGIGLVPYSAALNPQKFTIEAWVKTSVVNGQSPVSSSYGSGGWWMQSIDGWWFGDSSAGTFGNNQYLNDLAAIVPGYWSHVVITYDATRVSSGTFYPFILYVNGKTDGFIWGAPPVNTGGPLIVGGRGVSASTLADRFFDGQVDEVALYPRVLSAGEITNHFVARGIVIIPPTFNPPLLSQTVTTGKTVSFNTTVVGTSPSLQWYKETSPIPNATNATYTIASTAIADSGTYTLWGTNSAGTNSLSATLTVVPPVSHANVTNGLVLHLRFDGDTTDSSGRGNNGTPSSPTAPAFVPGIVGSQALQYTTATSGGSVSSASYVSLGAAGSGPPADLRFGAGTSFSVGLWLKLTNGYVAGDLPFIGTETNSANNPGWVLCPGYQTGAWQWDLNDEANNIDVNGPDNSINDGAWHNFVLTVDRAGAVAKSYLDGVLAASRSIASLGSIDHNNYWPIVIGQDPTALYPEAGSATLDDIGIWRRALTPLEVANIASAGSTGGQSFDTVGPIPLAITRSGGSVTLYYAAGTLLQSSTLGAGAVWVSVPGASVPSFTVTPSAAAQYYRVLVQ